MPLIRAFTEADDFEDKPVQAGEYDLRITSANLKSSENGKRISVGIAVEGVPGAATVFHTIFLPREDDDAAQVRRTMRDIRRFFAVFAIPQDADVDEDNLAETFVGQVGKCYLTYEEMTEKDAAGKKHGTGEFTNRLRLPAIR